jgi:3-dehydroquinate synthase
METINISAGKKTYPVHIGYGVSHSLAGILDKSFPNLTSIMIITDETVGKLYLEELKQILDMPSVFTKVVPAGEKAKTFAVYHDCLSFALEKKLDRKSIVLAFGGGAVGDLAGFVAATFMRGIPFIQIPTTILAHDSAVGGKVAINHPLGKNMIGTFYQPEAVIYDLNFLRSLPQGEVRSGFSEVIKHALISDRDFYHSLYHSIRNLEEISPEDMTSHLSSGIKVKRDIVGQDEKESGVRAYLNFGHTLGHAIEAEAGYGTITHGEAVAIGMVFALSLSIQVHSLPFDIKSFENWLEELGYSTKLPAGLSPDRLLERMKQDKKSLGQKVRFVLLKDIGQPVIQQLDDNLLLDSLKTF